MPNQSCRNNEKTMKTCIKCPNYGKKEIVWFKPGIKTNFTAYGKLNCE